MRVIRTEIYFDEDDVRGYIGTQSGSGLRYEGKNPGVAFLWMKGETISLGEIDDFKSFRLLRGGGVSDFLHPDDLRGALDLFIRDGPRPNSRATRGHLGSIDRQSGLHVQLEAAVWVHVLPNQRRQGTEISGGELS
jgi:hypothetical protein